jgi:hypothetical protein
MMLSWYSTESSSSSIWLTVGFAARRNAIVLPPQSWPRSQITGSRGAASTASAIRGAYDAGSARAAAIAAENLRNARREMPRSSSPA